MISVYYVSTFQQLHGDADSAGGPPSPGLRGAPLHPLHGPTVDVTERSLPQPSLDDHLKKGEAYFLR